MQEDMERPPAGARPVPLVRPGATPAPMRIKTRLMAIKDAVKAFVAERRDDRIGLVVFSDNAYVISPLTIDHDYVSRYVDMVDNEILKNEGMTAIGEGVALANYLLDRQSSGRADRRNRVVVLFTDGENNRGRDPVEVLNESDQASIRVHMVGVDLEDRTRNKESVQQLIGTVRQHGGRYFDANTVRDLDTASRTIDALEKAVLVSNVYTRDQPVYHWFAIPALMLFVVGMALRSVPYFIDQT
jgi:Ca-activated chloride channel family protein